MTHDPDVVEKVAKAMFDRRWNGYVEWENAGVMQEVWREWARAALDAIDALYADEVTV